MNLFKSDFTNEDCKRIWLEDKNTIDHVHQAVNDAKRIYEEKGQSKVRKWLTKLSARIQYYGAVLDALVQHHPEYVSLVWGTFKFIFMVSVNFLASGGAIQSRGTQLRFPQNLDGTGEPLIRPMKTRGFARSRASRRDWDGI